MNKYTFFSGIAAIFYSSGSGITRSGAEFIFNSRFKYRFLILYFMRAEAADPGMCDFPIRRESRAGNRIPGDFFAFFLGRARKEVPRRDEASGEVEALAA
ncbi:hypothetical protein [Rikenella microfusus]|uniref:hypothetical protein n=1 Tax=Rikenella microfusus TaxID=28139 RepID=UPI00146BE9F5|nr:hypothetical protein [Rikenella microfusus]